MHANTCQNTPLLCFCSVLQRNWMIKKKLYKCNNNKWLKWNLEKYLYIYSSARSDQIFKNLTRKFCLLRTKYFLIGKNRVESNPNKGGIYIKQRFVQTWWDLMLQLVKLFRSMLLAFFSCCSLISHLHCIIISHCWCKITSVLGWPAKLPLKQ